MPAATQARSDDGGINLSDYPEIINIDVFEQILEMDDDPDDREFSREIVWGFFEQAVQTMEKMRDLLARQRGEDVLQDLSALGHFLKGSSSTLGLVKVQRSCEKIQNYGNRTDVTGTQPQPDDWKSLRDIQTSLEDVDKEFREAKNLLNQFFGPGSFPDE